MPSPSYRAKGAPGGWPAAPPVRLYGHDGACDEVRQALAGADARRVAGHDQQLATSLLTHLHRIEAVIDQLEGRTR